MIQRQYMKMLKTKILGKAEENRVGQISDLGDSNVQMIQMKREKT